MEKLPTAARTITPMVIATQISSRLVPACRRRRAAWLINVVLQSIARNEGGDLPLTGDIARSPGNVYHDAFQIVAVVRRNGCGIQADGAIINRRICDQSL